jgi:thymidylate synthase (FAD)
MKFVEPAVYLIAETRIDQDQLKEMLDTLGGQIALEWLSKVAPASKSEAELLTEVAGRACYKSFGLGLNPNLTKIRQSSEEYLQNTLAKGDGSIFEHATCTFAFLNVSRVFTHELVRHRTGVAISQESSRYVRPSELAFWLPPDLEEKRAKIHAVVESIEKHYDELEGLYDWNAMDFSVKKQVTSALRRILPQGMANAIIWTANHRTIRHVITMRTDESAEVEIRLVFDKVAQLMKKKYPLIYQDFERKELQDKTGSWHPKYVKV